MLIGYFSYTEYRPTFEVVFDLIYIENEVWFGVAIFQIKRMAF